MSSRDDRGMSGGGDLSGGMGGRMSGGMGNSMSGGGMSGGNMGMNTAASNVHGISPQILQQLNIDPSHVTNQVFVANVRLFLCFL